MYAFYHCFKGDSVKKFLHFAYMNYTGFMLGDNEPFEDEYIMYGNSGIPITYSRIRERKPYNPDKYKYNSVSNQSI